MSAILSVSMLASFFQFNLSTDTMIFLAIVAVLVMGIVLGQDKVKTFALSIYVGLVLATELAQPVYDVLEGRGLTVGGSVGVTTVRIILLALPIIGLELGHNKQHKGRRRGLVLTMILSILTSALVIASIIGLLEPEARALVLSGSSLASILYGLRLVWLGAVPVVVIAESFAKPKER